MHLAWVSAKGFGPLVDAKLELAPGFNVITGPNESAKSSWHAAAYVALAGRRRGKGQVTEDKEFEARHKPWSGQVWAVGAAVTLFDGRRIEVQRDLLNNSDTQVFDLDLRRDLSSELEDDGSPDLLKLLGLNRKAYAATAAIRQAELLRVLNSADSLQQLLQGVADSAGSADATAAKALESLEKFRQENVGSESKAAVKPLRRAQVELAAAQENLRSAEMLHDEYLQHVADAEQLAHAADTEIARLTSATKRLDELVNAEQSARKAATDGWTSDRTRGEAAKNATEIADVEQRLVRIAELLADAEHNSGGASASPSPGAVPVAELRNTAASLEHLLSRTPDTSALMVGVELAANALGRCTEAVVEADARCAAAEAKVNLAVASRIEAAGRRRPSESTRSLRPALLAVGATALVAGVAIMAIGLPLLGAGLIVLGIVVGAGGSFFARDSSDGPFDAPEVDHSAEQFAAVSRDELARARTAEASAQLQLAEAQGQLRAADLEFSNWSAQRTALIDWCNARTLPSEPAQLRALAAQQELEREDAVATRGGLQAELTSLLGPDTVDELAAKLAATKARHPELVAAAEAADETVRLALGARDEVLLRIDLDPNRADLVPTIDAMLAEARREQDAARSSADRVSAQAHEVEGAVGQRAMSVPSVPAAAERLEVARTELERVEQLRYTLALTASFLADAQQHLYRSISPILRATLEPWLPFVTNGRYTRALIDAATLGVSVASDDGVWRGAEQLSLGTQEQIYLLLRMALAEHLATTENESCPLLLDDVTVQADGERTERILELLQRLSADRQVILFAQESFVADWARAHLDLQRDKLIELTAVRVG